MKVRHSMTSVAASRLTEAHRALIKVLAAAAVEQFLEKSESVPEAASNPRKESRDAS